MAIQVGGTTVIDNSRNLQNVQGIKTVGGSSILGSGDISVGASTSLGAVGTYTVAIEQGSLSTSAGYKEGRTTSGSNLETTGIVAGTPEKKNTATSTSGTSGMSNFATTNYVDNMMIISNQTYSGSWRLMCPMLPKGNHSSSGWGFGFAGLWVRYS